MSKPSRNKPCPCGSGHKYKKCCGKKEEGERKMNDRPRINKFREEVEKLDVTEAQLMERDQKVTYLRFKCQAELTAADLQHTTRAIEKLKAFGNEVFRLPDSIARTGILEENKMHIERLEKQIESQQPNRAHTILLSLFEEKFGLQALADENAVKDDPDTASELQDE